MIKKLKWISLLCILFFSTMGMCREYTIKTIPNIYKHSPTTYVANPDNIINQSDENDINTQLAILEENTGVEIAVVAVSSIGQDDVRDFGTKLFNYWKIGKNKKDNGLLILLVLDQRQITFEVGYGLEGILTDVTSYRLQQNYMVPLLKENQFSQGLVAGVYAVSQYLLSDTFRSELTEGDQETVSANNNLQSAKYWPMLAIFFAAAVVITVFIPKLLAKNDLKKQAEYVKRCMVIFGFLLFIALPFCFGYLLLSFLYRKYLIRRSVCCPNCQSNRNQEIKAPEKFNHLNEKELLEDQRLKSVNYHVYRCLNCDHIFKQAAINPQFKLCPSCQTYAMMLNSKNILIPATSYRMGENQETWKCANCNYRKKFKVKTPKLAPPITFNGGGGSSGGGFSGGGSSHGGGSSGGGGARSGF